MIIINALVVCCEVVIVRLSTNGPRGVGLFYDLMGGHNDIG
jgi:hypothetical protein